jgi:CDP-paratose 2-epimerase
LRDDGLKYRPLESYLQRAGIDERRPLDFHSPYGCSKGAADQYVLDYARSFGLKATVFRMSCIYGPRQFGTEDQGWVAHFLLRAQEDKPITLYGDGKQVRDILFVADLVEAMLCAEAQIDQISGCAFNMGGGPSNTISLLELLDLIEELEGKRPEIRFAGVRTGDQRYYVSNTGRFRAITGWTPKVNVQKGVGLLHRWLAKHGTRARAGAVQNTASTNGPGIAM